MKRALSKFGEDEISYVFKYVDDIGYVKESCLDLVRESIEREHGMKLKVCLEDDENEINYLQVKLKRHADRDNLVEVRWVQKEYGSKVIFDRHSFHPWQMKKAVVSEFVKNALLLSSKCYWKEVTSG